MHMSLHCALIRYPPLLSSPTLLAEPLPSPQIVLFPLSHPPSLPSLIHFVCFAALRIEPRAPECLTTVSLLSAALKHPQYRAQAHLSLQSAGHTQCQHARLGFPFSNLSFWYYKFFSK